MTRHHLLDASALLALILNEAGADRVQEVFDDSQIHSVNLAEVAKKMFQKGMQVEQVEAAIFALELEVIEDLTAGQAILIGELLTANRRTGLSLGDAVCLTTAASMEMKAVTADRRWAECSWPDTAPDLLQIR